MEVFLPPARPWSQLSRLSRSWCLVEIFVQIERVKSWALEGFGIEIENMKIWSTVESWNKGKLWAGAGQNWIFSYSWRPDKYGNIWKERPIKLLGIHNKQDNWKLPVKRRSYRIQNRSPFYDKIKVVYFHQLVASLLKKVCRGQLYEYKLSQNMKVKVFKFHSHLPS